MSLLQIKKLRHEEAKDVSYKVSDVEFETRSTIPSSYLSVWDGVWGGMGRSVDTFWGDSNGNVGNAR